MLIENVLSNLTKSYSDKSYRHTALLRHKGVLIAFTMDESRRMHYAVMDQSPANATSPLDVGYWPGGPTELAFPDEIAAVGFGVADQVLLPVFRKGAATPEKNGSRIPARDRDLFLSSTARFTADAPFQTLSDGQHVYVFRQAIDANHPGQVHKLDKDGVPVKDANGNLVPLVDATLLVDRFVLIGAELQPKREVRFQRSRSKHRPASRKDSLGPKDLDGNPFTEPTQELRFVGNLQSGRFSVLLVPTTVNELERWQIFAQNRRSGRIDAFSVERAADGLFNTRGTSIFAPTREGHAETALHLAKPTDHVALQQDVFLHNPFTVEAWIKPAQTQSTKPQVLIGAAVSGPDAGGLSVLVVAQTRLRVDFGSGQGDRYTSKSMLTPNTWNHIALTFDDLAFRFYINGNLRDKIEVPADGEKPTAKPVRTFGAAKDGFTGTLDELRCWNRVRSARELETDLHQRLTGLEPGLVGYWRFDEAHGSTAFDQTHNDANGALIGGQWVTSDAPVGDNSGVNRNSFQVAERKAEALEMRAVASGLTSLLYFQQTNVPSGYDGQQKPLKQSARIMLAFAVANASTPGRNHIAVLDFAVSATGKIAQVPDYLPLDRVNPTDHALPSINDQLEAARTAEEEVRILSEALAKATKTTGQRLLIWQTLVTAREEARVTVFSAVNYDGRSRRFGIQEVPYSELNNPDAELNFNDSIASIKIPSPLQITVFEHDLDNGQSATFKEDTADLGAFWRVNISAFRVQTKPELSAQILHAEKNHQLALAEQQVLSAKLLAAQNTLNTLNHTLAHGAEAYMPTARVDAQGLSVSGGLLGFAWTNDTPFLFDSATGSLALYFRGADDQFFAAYYATFTERAQYPLDDTSVAAKKAVICIARSTDLDMDKIVLEIADGPDDATCTVRIAGVDIEETWRKVPRAPERFARVLNGEAGHEINGRVVGYRERVGDGIVTENNGLLTLSVPNGLKRALEKDATLILGNTRLTLSVPADTGATIMPVTSAFNGVFSGTAQPLFFLEYDYAKNASTTKVPGDLFGGSLLLRAVVPDYPANEDPAGPVANQRVTSGATLSSKWSAAQPGSTLFFDGGATRAVLGQEHPLRSLDMTDDLTLEAWIRPIGVSGQARILHHQSEQSGYTLGLKPDELLTALVLNGTDDYVELAQGVLLQNTFTLEAWIYPEATDDAYHAILGGGAGSLNIGVNRAPSLYVYQKNRIHGGFGDGAAWHSVTTEPRLISDAWNHVAASFDGTRFRIFINGLQALETDSFAGKTPIQEPIRLIGKLDNFFQGRIDDVRVWKRARTESAIRADMHRRLVGNETDLLGYWHFHGMEARDYSRFSRDGRIMGAPTQAASPLPAFAVFAGVNGKFVQSKAPYPAGNWMHLAVVFQQDYGIQFNGFGAFLDCGNDETLNLNGDLTLELFAGTHDVGWHTHGLLERNAGNGESPYNLLIDFSGRLVFQFDDDNGKREVFTSTIPVPNQQSTVLSVTRKRESVDYRISDNETKTLAWYTIGLHIDGHSDFFIYAFDEETRKAAEETRKASPDTVVIRSGSAKLPNIGRSNGHTHIGRNESRYFKGVISEVRIWSVAREITDLGQEVAQGVTGLVSWWRFEEREGTRANDSNGQNHAQIEGAAVWIKDPNPQRSGLTLIVNDQGPVNTEPRSGLPMQTGLFALGALDNNEHYHGELEEVRIWKSARTREQVDDNLFRRLNGEFDQIIAYYTFDAEKNNKLTDNGLLGNHLEIQGPANYELSTAPIGDDAPVVRSALAGVRTPFSGFIHATPAVQEYGDMQVDSRGDLIGVFKRCYGFIQNNELKLLTGYKVGDLAVEWIGQVQYAPQLIGFIEGAPPVPSENLTMPSVEMIGDLDDYNETSTVAFSEAEESTFTYSASKEQGFGLEVEAALQFGFKSGTKAGGGLGFISLTSIEESKVLVGVRTRFEAMWSWMDQASVGTTRQKGKKTSLELRGRYTTPAENAQEPFGRRFIPDNTGLALVQSETADVFALRLKHNNALISFSLQPNPDIPKDWNIIHFPINPQYVKQGTLDGKVGPQPDVDYPNALTYSNDVSYFKPVEAYARKNEIQKQERERETYFAQFAAKDKGRAAYFPEDSALSLTEQEEMRKKARRNLVNTYVWTSDGGLFAETSQVMETHTETSGGTYEFRGAAGIDVRIGFAIVKVASQFELNAMFVGQHKLEVSKTRESRTGFELEVSVEKVERDIYKRDPDNQKIVLLDTTDPKRPKPVKTPYKVDAYRFMSFYLEPQTEHFDQFFGQVVDPLWIAQSDDPAANALREARQEGKKPACWRILHRVTYVSRVLPPLDDSAPPSLEKALQTLDLESNYELIKALEPYVRPKLGSFTDFTEAVRNTLRLNLPELQPHASEIIGYMSQYFGISAGADNESGQFGETTLSELAPNQPPIVFAGADQTIGLDGASADADLEASVVDDRLEKPEALFVTWEKTAGPDDMAFGNIHAVATKATFRKRGRYHLQLTATDGILEAAHTTVVIVNERPVISAGPPIETNALKIDLIGMIADHGLGDPQTGSVTVKWLQSGGLGAVHFDDEDQLQTKATFEKPGNYLIKLLVSNGTFDANAEVVVRIAARVERNLQALYTFEENSGLFANDVSGTGEPLPLQLPDAQSASWIKGGLHLKKPALLKASGSVHRLLDALIATNEITLEAWIKPAKTAPTGLARIITCSASAGARNFTLAQQGDQFHFHLRTSTTNDNASNKVLAASAPTAGRMTHVVCTRNAAGMAHLFVDGVELASRKIDGHFGNWASAYELGFGNEFGPSNPDNAWLGELHLAAVYSRALAREEIQQNFRFGPNQNLPPVAFAGADTTVLWPEYDWSKNSLQEKSFPLNGRVTHDRPTTGTIRWEQIGGPAKGVVFENENNVQTSVRVTQKGQYRFRLTAQDGELLSSSETVVVVHVPPRIALEQPLQKLSLTGAMVETELRATLLDDGRGDQQAGHLATFQWQLAGGPAPVDISDTDTLQARAVFTKRGVYRLQLRVHNGVLETVVPVDITVNQLPLLSVPAPLLITLPLNKVSLGDLITDTGLGNPAADALIVLWKKLDGPGNVAFADAAKPKTTATFDAGGFYRLRFEVRNPDDAALYAFTELPVTVNTAPLVHPGADPKPLLLQMGQTHVSTWLDATVSDDGLPDPPGATALLWSKKSGPANLTIVSPQSDFTEVRFNKKGKYVLQVEAGDGAAKTSGAVTVVVNSAPVVDAGPKQHFTLAEGATEVMVNLDGKIVDNGLGDSDHPGALTLAWKQVFGPGTSSINNPDKAATGVILPNSPGVYTFSLVVSNGYDTATDTVEVALNLPPDFDLNLFENDLPTPLQKELRAELVNLNPGNPNLDGLRFEWKQLSGPGVISFQPAAGNGAVVVATFPKAGFYSCSVTATNNKGFLIGKTTAFFVD